MATLYWGPSGGNASGTWDLSTTTNWFSNVGRTTPAGVAPTSADDVVFDGASDNGIAFNVTLGTGAACRNFTATGLDQVMTLTISAAGVSIAGSLIIPASNFVTSGTNTMTFTSTVAGNTITTNGVLLTNSFAFDGVGGEWTLQDACTTSRDFTLTNGTFNLNNYTFTARRLTSRNSNIRAMNFGTGKFVASSNNLFVLDARNATNLTLSGSKDVEFSYSGAVGTRTIYPQNYVETPTFNPNGLFNIKVISGTDIVLLNGATATSSSIDNLDFTGFAGTLTNRPMDIYGDATFSAGMTPSAGTYEYKFAATSGTSQITTNGKTLDFPLSFDGIGGTFEFQDALTQGATKAFTITNGTVKLKAGATSTVGAFATSGSNQKTLQSTLAGSQATLSQASGTVSVSYLTIQDINATGGATWDSLWSNNNVDAGNNTGWVFGDPPITLATEYTYALRSFTQPRRF